MQQSLKGFCSDSVPEVFQNQKESFLEEKLEVPRETFYNLRYIHAESKVLHFPFGRNHKKTQKHHHQNNQGLYIFDPTKTRNKTLRLRFRELCLIRTELCLYILALPL